MKHLNNHEISKNFIDSIKVIYINSSIDGSETNKLEIGNMRKIGKLVWKNNTMFLLTEREVYTMKFLFGVKGLWTKHSETNLFAVLKRCTVYMSVCTPMYTYVRTGSQPTRGQIF